MSSRKFVDRRAGFIGCVALALAALLPAAGASAASIDEQRAAIRDSALKTLNQLYASQPSSKAAIQKAAGYAVFSEITSKIFVAGGGGGKGIVVDTVNPQETFMMMVTVDAGLGWGVTKSHLVWVFERESDLKNFVANGLVVGADVNLQVNPGGNGGLYDGAVQIQPGVWLYQLSDEGLVASLTVQGTKYFKDSDLN
jgi:lipid-binding SYLF domain-containing protein